MTSLIPHTFKLPPGTLSTEGEALFSLLQDVKRTENVNVTLRVAGGWVRDLLLGRSSKDIDIVLETVPYNTAINTGKNALTTKGIASSFLTPCEKNSEEMTTNGNKKTIKQENGKGSDSIMGLVNSSCLYSIENERGSENVTPPSLKSIRATKKLFLPINSIASSSIASEDLITGQHFATCIAEHLQKMGEVPACVSVVKCNPDKLKNIEIAQMKVRGIYLEFCSLRGGELEQCLSLKEMNGMDEQRQLNKNPSMCNDYSPHSVPFYVPMVFVGHDVNKENKSGILLSCLSSKKQNKIISHFRTYRSFPCLFSYPPFGSPSQGFVSGTPRLDAFSRDFTINALFYNIDTQCVEDYTYGLEDLQMKRLRTPLPPRITLAEDPLRILRGIRLAAQLNFQLDNFIIHYVRDSYHLVEQLVGNISRERVGVEVTKMLSGNDPLRSLQLLLDTKVLYRALLLEAYFREHKMKTNSDRGARRIGTTPQPLPKYQHNISNTYDQQIGKESIVARGSSASFGSARGDISRIHQLGHVRIPAFEMECGQKFLRMTTMQELLIEPLKRREMFEKTVKIWLNEPLSAVFENLMLDEEQHDNKNDINRNVSNDKNIEVKSGFSSCEQQLQLGASKVCLSLATVLSTLILKLPTYPCVHRISGLHYCCVEYQQPAAHHTDCWNSFLKTILKDLEQKSLKGTFNATTLNPNPILTEVEDLISPQLKSGTSMLDRINAVITGGLKQSNSIGNNVARMVEATRMIMAVADELVATVVLYCLNNSYSDIKSQQMNATGFEKTKKKRIDVGNARLFSQFYFKGRVREVIFNAFELLNVPKMVKGAPFLVFCLVIFSRLQQFLSLSVVVDSVKRGVETITQLSHFFNSISSRNNYYDSYENFPSSSHAKLFIKQFLFYGMHLLTEDTNGVLINAWSITLPLKGNDILRLFPDIVPCNQIGYWLREERRYIVLENPDAAMEDCLAFLKQSVINRK